MSENPFLDQLIYDKSTGALLYKGVRCLLIRPEAIVGFQKDIIEFCGQEAGEKLFAGGYTGGRLSSKKYRKLYDYSNQNLIEFILNMGNQIGWGCFHLERYDHQAKCLLIYVTNSPFAAFYENSSRGVCHLIRGVLTGMASVVFEINCVSEETDCLAKGDQKCLFIIEAKE